MMRMLLVLALATSIFAGASPIAAQDQRAAGSFSALARDRRAAAPGDVITIVIYENAFASNQATSGSKESAKLGGQISAGSSLDESGALGLKSSSDNQGSTGHSGKMVAEMSAVVEDVLPNGDLQVAGEQKLNINGERTHRRGDRTGDFGHGVILPSQRQVNA